MFVILSGAGTLRYGADRFPLRANDVIAAPPGSGKAHQIINDSDGELRYLAISTMEHPEVAEYPDTERLAWSPVRRQGGGPMICSISPDGNPASIIGTANPEAVRCGAGRRAWRRPNLQAPRRRI
jgi:uncharacterized cupin superfamily protein